MNADAKRQELLNRLKSAGVKAPASMYPKSDMWSLNTTPEDMFDRMQAHLIEIAQFKTAQQPSND